MTETVRENEQWSTGSGTLGNVIIFFLYYYLSVHQRRHGCTVQAPVTADSWVGGRGRSWARLRMESFNPTPEWLGQGRDFLWSYAEIWGFPCV